MRWPWNLLREVMSRPVTGHPETPADPDELEILPDGWLVGERVKLVPSVRHSPLTSQVPISITWHYTATDVGTAESLARRIRTYKRGKDRAASWHVLIGADGTLWQSVSLYRGAWHCARGTIDGHRVNACSVGVELEGHGRFFTDEQIRAAERLVRCLYLDFNIRAEQAVRGHSEFDPARRKDPGPIWQGIIEDIVGRVYG